MAHASFVLCGVLVMTAVQSAPANSKANRKCSTLEASSAWPERSSFRQLVTDRADVLAGLRHQPRLIVLAHDGWLAIRDLAAPGQQG
jgi:hypothetical protein